MMKRDLKISSELFLRKVLRNRKLDLEEFRAAPEKRELESGHRIRIKLSEKREGRKEFWTEKIVVQDERREKWDFD